MHAARILMSRGQAKETEAASIIKLFRTNALVHWDNNVNNCSQDISREINFDAFYILSHFPCKVILEGYLIYLETRAEIICLLN